LKSRIGTWLVIVSVLSCGIPAAEAVVPRALKVIGIRTANAMIPTRCNLFAAMANEDTIPPEKLVLNATSQIPFQRKLQPSSLKSSEATKFLYRFFRS
jgi:hypothetical protein